MAYALLGRDAEGARDGQLCNRASSAATYGRNFFKAGFRRCDSHGGVPKYGAQGGRGRLHRS
eukprot:4494550-Pyramimonas_sp.AAC.1